jgi:hypothetical protein
MFATLAITTLSASLVLAANDRASFDPFASNTARQADIARLQALTTGTPITTFCTGAALAAGQSTADCKVALAKELVDTQIAVQRDFFDALVKAFFIFGQPFDKNKINNFDNLNECKTEVDTFSDFLDATQIQSVKNFCNNVKNAADNLRETVRSQLATEEATTNNQARVDLGLAKLDRSHLSVFDKSLNTAQQNAFIDLTEDADRAKQTFEGFLLGQLSETVIEFKQKNYYNYKGEEVDVPSTANEVEILLALAVVELAKNQLIIDAGIRLNALAAKPTPEALAVAGALKLAAARKDKIVAPVAVQWRLTDVDATQEKAITDIFKASLGPETFFLKGVAQANGKLTIDFATGMDESEIGTRDSEFGLTCVQNNAVCTVVEDVHQPSFDLAQYKAATDAPINNNDGDAPYNPPATTVYHHVVDDSASSLFLAAGALIASIVLFF